MNKYDDRQMLRQLALLKVFKCSRNITMTIRRPGQVVTLNYPLRLKRFRYVFD